MRHLAVTLTFAVVVSALACSKPSPPASDAGATAASVGPSASPSPSAAPKGPATLGSGLTHPPKRLVVDATSAYWTNPGKPNASGHHEDGVLMRVPLEGGKVETIASSLRNPEGLAVDATSLFIAGRGTEKMYVLNDDGGVSKVALAGGTPVPLSSGRKQPIEVALVGADVICLEGGSWTSVKGMPFAHKNNPDGSLVKLSKGAPVVLASGLTAPHGLAVDATRAYFALDGKEEGSLMAVPFGGGASVVVAKGKPRVSLVSSDSTTVVFAVPGGGGVDARVLRVVSGGEPAVVLSRSSSFTALAVLGDTVFAATEEGDILSVPKSGGEPRPVATGQTEVRALAVSRTHVLWASGDKLLRATR